MRIGGVIIAGGKAARMQHQVKPLLPLHGSPLIEYVISQARPQVDFLVLNTNHPPNVFAAQQLPMIGDAVPGQTGPLLGIAAAMAWYLESPAADGSPLLSYDDALACFPGDVPRFPADFVSNLRTRLLASNADVAMCRHGTQLQPLFSLWSCRSCNRLKEFVTAGRFGPKQVYQEFSHVIVDIDSDRPGEFFNINSAEDLAEAVQIIPA